MQCNSKAYLFINLPTAPAQAAALTSHHISHPVSPESRLLPAFNCFQSEESMIKAAKKLKFWPRKKKKRKTHHQPYCPHPPPQRPPPPPPPRHYYWPCSSSSSSTQPSAPPLPPWLDAEYTYETPLAPPFQPAPEFSYHHHHHDDPVPSQPETAFNGGSSTQYPYPIPTASYQQYTDPNPVYGVPVIETQTPRATTKERCYAAATATRVLNCVVDLGIRLFHCICPCFRIREVNIQ